MTDDPSSSIVPQASPEAKKTGRSGCRGLTSLIIVAFLIAAPVAAGSYWMALKYPGPMTGQNLGPVQERVAELERKIQALDTQVRDLGARVDSIAASAPATPAAPVEAPTVKAPPSASAAELAHVQNALAELTATVDGLQAEVKQNGSTAASIQATTQAALAEAISFLQLRAAAASGHAFARELAAALLAAKNDPGFEDLLGKLDAAADKGAATIPVLRERLADEAGGIVTAIAKADAQTWWQRVLAEVKGLVVVRPLQGGSTDNATLDAMEASLARDDLPAALDAIKNLPPDAQKKLDDWRMNAEAREQIDTALQAMADHLIAATAAAPPPVLPVAAPATPAAPKPAAPAPPPSRAEPAPDTQDDTQ